MDGPRMRRRARLVRRRTKDTMSQTWRIRAAQLQRIRRAEALMWALGHTPTPVWCAVANVVAERPYGIDGAERRRGTKHFAPGAKVYCLKPLWDWYPYRKQQGHLMVIGRARHTHRYIAIVIRAVWLTNWRVQLVYSPHVIREMVRINYEMGADLGYTYEDVLAKGWVWDGTPESKQLAEHIVQTMRERLLYLRGEMHTDTTT